MAGEKGFEELNAALRRLLLHTRVTHNADFILKGAEDVSFRSDASRYQADLRNLFAWMCKPKSNSQLRIPALQFLESNAQGVHWCIDFDSDWAKLDFEEHKDPIFYFTKRVEYDSIMAPICKFIFEEIDPPPAEGLPIRICKRSKCGKFYVRERSPKQFCSASCRAQAHQSKSPRLALKYVSRLEKIYDLDLLRQKFRSPALQTRLASIEAQWPDWAIERIKQLNERVATGSNHAEAPDNRCEPKPPQVQRKWVPPSNHPWREAARRGQRQRERKLAAITQRRRRPGPERSPVEPEGRNV
jgi:hypothetical protein